MKLKFTCFITLGMLVGTAAMAAVPYNFKAGEPAHAADVNANFADLDSRITVYDYHMYVAAANVTSKTFNLSPDGSFCSSTSQETDTIVQTPAGANTTVEITQKWQDSNGLCRWRKEFYLNTPTQQQILSAENYDTSGALTNTLNIDTPMVLGTSAMVKGAMFGGASVVKITNPGQAPVYFGAFIENRAALGIEDVTVPAGSFTGCLKIMVNRQSGGFGAYRNITWTCPGVGVVKRIQHNPDIPSDRIWELSSYTTN